MGLRFNKRINLGKGFGFHISKSGITPSYRNKRGSLSSKGYSIRTGISGITYRKTISKAKNNGCLLMLISLILTSFLLTINSCKNKTSQPRNKWYQGGTLHKSKIIDWKNASERNKLATCGDFCANIYKRNNSIDEVKLIATNLVICIDEATKESGNTLDNSSISEIASMCLLLMEKSN
ncbi:DUF4236 domain-containing protein [Aquimarina sp. AU58]|uniref:DUF4236 domain-containing protein n=1 Tax=Aquimarina sp. AU58 TaxID=1874112 RepID=UPI000D6E1CA7|nr:DUF4236 domain-containing protein [Aquimarina sp. AU58]